MINIEELWTRLEDESKNKTSIGIQKIRILPESKFNIFLGYEKPKNRRVFLVIVSADSIPHDVQYPKSKGFEVQPIILPEETNIVNLDLILTNPRFIDVFSCLIQDIMDQISHQENEALMVNEFLSRLVTWQQFLDQYDPEGLSDEAQRGLFGELWVLRKYLMPILGQRISIESWQRPGNKQQDFIFNGNAVEVKTTISKQHQKLQITSEHQLDDKGLHALFLYHISLINTTGNGEKLPDIVDSIRKLIEHNPLIIKKFDDSLINAGYINAHIDRYLKNSYLIRSSKVYKVQDGFPRIIENNILNGVGEVQYSISVSECLHYMISEEEFSNYLRSVVNGN